MQSRLFLVGFMGAGKSTMGPLLAGRLRWDFVDLDEKIEHDQNRTIREIFETEGEPGFRRIETQALTQLEGRKHCVVALGGGAFVEQVNRLVVARLGVSVFLDCRLDVILARCPADGTRPLLQTPALVEQLYESRLPLYRKCDVCINVSDLTPDEASEAILLAVGTTVKRQS